MRHAIVGYYSHSSLLSLGGDALVLRSSQVWAGGRDFLRVGDLTLGGLSLPKFLAARAGASGRNLPIHDKSVVFVVMHGGPSQIETCDPKCPPPGNRQRQRRAARDDDIESTSPFGSRFAPFVPSDGDVLQQNM